MPVATEDTNRERDIKDENLLTVYIQHLEKKLRALETEKQIVEGERLRLKQELNILRNEIDLLREPPLIHATVIDLLKDDGIRAIVKSSSGPDFVVALSRTVKPEKIQVGMDVALNQGTFNIVEILPSHLDPFIKGMELIDNIPDITYDDIGGLDQQILEVRETVELPLIKPDIFKKIGITPPKGVLFHGPPGTGKTLMAKVVAHETNATFIRVIGSELVQKFIGEGARYVREIFQLARKKAPTILFLDELDAIAAVRMEDSTSGDREVQRTLMQLLSELDGFDERGDVKFIGATNRIDILDPALLRAGRFDRIVEFPTPNFEARQMILKIHMRPLNIGEEIDLKMLVQMTENATGADLKGICVEAGMFAIRRNADEILQDDFINAINKVMGIKKPSSSKLELYV